MKHNAKRNKFSVGSLKRTRSRRGVRGQSLVEYALVFVLVSIVVIVSAAAIGTAVQRLYAIVAGSLGTQVNNSTSAQDIIDIYEGAQMCLLFPSGTGNPQYPNGATIVNFRGSTNVPITDLTLSTDTGLLLAGGAGVFVADSSPGGWIVSAYAINPNKSDASICPRTVVVQSKRNNVAIATVNIQAIPFP
jgi:Flp pilus assembly pilin Flp